MVIDLAERRRRLRSGADRIRARTQAACGTMSEEERDRMEAEAVAIRDDVLVVDVDQPIWHTQLGFLEADLLGRVNEVAGLKLTRIEARVHPG